MNIVNLKIALASALSALVVLFGSLLAQYHSPAPQAFGSVAVSNDYTATSTSPTIALKPALWSLTATSSTDNLARTGTFGSFIQVAAGSAGGSIDIYDATTTNVNARTGQLATSSILLASLPNNATVGTYTYDLQFKWGLMVVTTGTVGTTTLTYRINK